MNEEIFSFQGFVNEMVRDVETQLRNQTAERPNVQKFTEQLIMWGELVRGQRLIAGDTEQAKGQGELLSKLRNILIEARHSE